MLTRRQVRAAAVALNIESFVAGYETGDDDGQRRGARWALRQVLNARFDAVPYSVRRRLLEADLQTLKLWFRRALTARSVAAVLAAD
jgi:hypothetical protein